MGPDSVEGGVTDPNWLTETLTEVGGIFVTLLRTIVPALVFLAIVASHRQPARRHRSRAPGLEDAGLVRDHRADLGRSSASRLGLLLEPGRNTSGQRGGGSRALRSTGSWLDFLTGLVPANILGLQAERRR